MRKPLIAGNWKMNLDVSEATELARLIAEESLKHNDRDILIAPSHTNLYPVYEVIKNSKVLLSAQNMHYEDKGAFTGEVSARQIKSAGCSYVIIGHSERRNIFGETNDMLNKKIKKALSENLNVIYCVGEKLQERENGVTFEIIKQQLSEGLKEVNYDEFSKIVIAYEPVWAIGTGKTATPEQAEEVHKFIREYLERNYGKEISENTRILYGGSVNDKNIDELMKAENIDGVLVGGASIVAEKFIRIINFR